MGEMRREVACAVVAAVMAYGGAAQAQGDCQLVGFTTAVTMGDIGALGMTGLCQAGVSEGGLSCNTTPPVVYSSAGGRATVTVEVRSACPSGVDINLVSAKNGDVATQNVSNGSIQVSTLSPKSQEIQVVPAAPEAGSFRVQFSVN